jgi:hypothetical protein
VDAPDGDPEEEEDVAEEVNAEHAPEDCPGEGDEWADDRIDQQ